MMKRTVSYIFVLTFIAVNLAYGSKLQIVTETGNSTIKQETGKSLVDTITVETQCASRESKYVSASVSLTLPVGDGVAQTIRQSLLDLMGTQIYLDADYIGEGNMTGPVFTGNTKNLKALCKFYCNNIFKVVAEERKAEYEQNVQYINEDTTLTAKQRKEQIEQIGMYQIFAQDVTLSKCYDAANYVVFDAWSYGERGGVHGGIGGYGYIIFNKTTGKQVKTILKPGSELKMQRLIKDGLKQYMGDCNEPDVTDEELMDDLMLPDDSGIIPLPGGNGIAPTEEGLIFVYSQYEIASYAYGMPSFVIPYDKVKEFMTDEALELIPIGK